MMTKTIRKAVSILCVVAVLMSFVIIALPSTTSAFKITDTPTGTTVKLTFEDNAGIVKANSSANSYVADPADANNITYKVQHSATGWTQAVLGKNDSATAVADAFILKPGTQYVVTMKYKLGKDTQFNTSKQISVGLYYVDADSTASSRGTLVEGSTVTHVADDVGGIRVGRSYKMNADGQWISYKYIFETPASLGDETSLAISWDVTSKANIYHNDVFVDEVNDFEPIDKTYVFNGVKDGTNEYWTPNNQYLLTGSVDANGYQINASTKYFSYGTVGFRTRETFFAVYDPDCGYIKFDRNSKYYINVKYKVNSVGAAGWYYSAVGIGYSATEPGTKSETAVFSFGTKYSQNNTNEGYTTTLGQWDTLEAIVDGKQVKDNWLHIVVDNYAATSITIESITVKQLANPAGVATIKYDTMGGNAMLPSLAVNGSTVSLAIPKNSDADKGFAGWFTDRNYTTPVSSNYTVTGDVTLYAKWDKTHSQVTFVNNGIATTERLAVGLKLDNAERPIGAAFFEGWCTDKELTQFITTVPAEDITVYAKYNIMYSAFNQGGASGSRGSNAAVIVPDPDDPTNSVMSHLVASDANTFNFEVALSDIAGAPAYTLQTNTSYTISYKVKVSKTDAKVQVVLYTGSDPAAFKAPAGSSYTFAEGSLSEAGSEWVTVTTSIKTGESLYKDRVNWNWQDNLYFCFVSRKSSDSMNNLTKGITVYIDDLTIVPEFTEVPEGAVGVFFETNSEEISPVLGYAGEKIIMPENPTLAGHKFVGWYTDKQFKNKFTSNVFPAKTTTLYAKWEMTEWVMDFESSYDKTSISGRYNIETENGNTYLRYNYEQGKAVSTSAPEEFGRATFNLGSGKPYLGTEGVTYTVKFKYKVVETNSAVKTGIRSLSSQAFNTWTNGILQSSAVNFNTDSNKWQEGEFVFSPQSMYSANALGFAVCGDSTVLLDDFVITANIDVANVYGTTMFMFNANGGKEIDAIGGNPGEKIYLPTTTRDNFYFKGWYLDKNCTRPFTETVYTEDSRTLYAGWALKSLTENFEELPATVQMRGVSGVYDYYSKRTMGYDEANVNTGSASIYRRGTAEGTKGFTLCRDNTMTLDVGSEYTLTIYVKPTNVTDPNGTINLTSLGTNTGITSPTETEPIITVGELTVGEWQKISYTFTAKESFVGISTTAGNDMYFDTAKIVINNYVGSDTGDTSVSPVIVCLLVVIACGALVITGKKVFNK